MNKTKRNFNFSGIVALVLALLLVAIIIPINLIVNYFDVNIDTTPSKMYSLTDKTRDLLESVKDKNIEMYVLARGVDDIEDFSKDDLALPLYYGLKQYSEYDNIKITCFDPQENPNLAKSLDPEGFLQLSNGDIVLKCNDLVHRVSDLFVDVQDSNGVVVEEKYVGENNIAGAIKTVTEGDIANIYFLTGHGEKTIKENYTFFEAQTKNANYDLDELNLSSVDAVPEDAKIIYICAPKNDITLSEKEKLMDFMAKGGNISLFLSPNEEKFRYTNLEALLGEYNIVIHYDRIYETSSDMCKKDDPTTILFSLTAPDESQTVDLTTDLNSLVSSGIYPYITSSRSFGLINGKNSAVLECNPLMQTAQGQSGYTSCSEPFGGTETDTESTSGLFNLACYSYNKSNNSKLVVFGNADFFDDENCGMGYTIIPIYLSLSSISWMYDSEYNMEIPDKNRAFDYMHFDSEAKANKVLAIFVIAPLCVTLFGVIIWLRRRSA
ncbi:MAG: hypothetical protein E7506_06300 [Ruminococcus sp.]|nr:hypothetical protein [Ruminococcus sp.]